jgi:GNAT superfamily N-acetyltransferase
MAISLISPNSIVEFKRFQMIKYGKQGMFIHIREATLQDSPKLRPLMEQLGYPLSLTEMENRVNIYASPNYKLFVSTDGPVITGLVALSMRELIVRPSKKMVIDGLVVDVAYRRKGIALQLMQKAEAYAKEVGCAVIELTSGVRRASLGSHEFYKQLGYANEGPMAKLYLRKEL